VQKKIINCHLETSIKCTRNAISMLLLKVGPGGSISIVWWGGLDMIVSYFPIIIIHLHPPLIIQLTP
jgi:hypothetical protein